MEASSTPPALREAVRRLEAVGLDEKDALIYAHLCVHGPTKASDVASLVRLHRTEAYRSLDNLIRRGFVTASLDRPALYAATPVEKVFDDALAQHQQRRAQLERARSAALETLRELRASGLDAPPRSSHKIIQGRAAIYAAAEAMVRRATRRQWMASTYFAPQNATESNTLYGTTLARAAEGIEMRFLLRESPGIVDAMRPALAHKGIEIRFFEPGGALRFTIVDDREILIWLVTDAATDLAAREDVAMWTDAPDFIFAQRLLYERLWETARPA